jgi:phage terminase large subunit
MEIDLPAHGWTPRGYQLPSWTAWEKGCKRLILVWHRRAGKDEVALNKAAVAAHERVANYWHCLPQYEQARKAIWEAVNPHTGRRRIDEAFPPEIRARTDSQSMTIEFKSGSIWKVVGSDNPNSLVGAPPAGIVFSEWALSNPSAWGYLAPILAENGGWAEFISTPRGRNHMKTMLDMARKNPWSPTNPRGWFAEVLTPTETGFPLDLIEEQRKEYHGIFGQDAGDALIEQEYWCSFEAAILGSYYGREMLAVERDGRILPDLREDLPVHTAWDLGVGDSTAIWCFQATFSGPRIIDYYEASGYAVDHYAEWLDKRGYHGHDFVPHDAKVREWTSSGPDGKAKTRLQTLIELKRKPRLVPNHKLEDGINAARRLLPSCLFDEKTEEGMECLRQYRREWDDDKKVFKNTPLHDWTSHGADAFRYLAMAWRELANEPAAKPQPIKGVMDMTFDELLKSTPKRGRERITL